MRVIDGVILGCCLVGVTIWIIFSGKDGFKGNNAMIVARSIAVSSTMEGYVENTPPPVGSKFEQKELLVKINNGRVDRTKLAALESEIAYLESEIANVHSQQAELAALLETIDERAGSYAKWMRNDIELRKTVSMRQLEVARMRSQIKSAEVKRLSRLLKSKHASEVDVQVAISEARIARSQVELARAELGRSELLLGSLRGKETLSEDGEPSYWVKMSDDLSMRFFNNRSKIALLKSELSRARTQAKAEREHLSSNFSEEHRAPFSGVVNATFVTSGTRVASGTSLLQVLDCTRPTVIIPIPEHRIGEFSVGMKATVYPIDSAESLQGSITHISSGPLLSHDSTIQVEQQLTLGGNRAIVGFEDNETARILSASCETSRKAVAVIHTDSMFGVLSNWISASMQGMDVQASGYFD